MHRFSIALIAVFLVISPRLAHADLSVCGSKIRTVETLLERLGEQADGETYANLVARPFRKIDTSTALAHMEEARSYLQEGLEFECDFHAIAALSALGYLL